MRHPHSRGERRALAERWKRRVAPYYGGHGQHDPRIRGIHAATRKPCSCWMCGNPRRFFREPTIQERRAA